MYRIFRQDAGCDTLFWRKHDEDEKAVRRFAKDLHAPVDDYLEDFTFVSWTALPNAAMPGEDDPAQES